ncbi:MAG: hypothetical protein HDT02_03675 [Bacteroidales bacterium]|nr:hypothetical protein [Bacteroidales bacterium]
MSSVETYFADSTLSNSSSIRFFYVEVISYDGESDFCEVEARSSEEAQQIAASRYPDCDYTVIQSCYE